MEAIARRAAATAIPLANEDDSIVLRSPEYIAPPKEDLARHLSVDMITPYQGRIVPYFHDTLEEIEENETTDINGFEDKESKDDDKDFDQTNHDTIDETKSDNIEEKVPINFFHNSEDYQHTLNSNPDKRIIYDHEIEDITLETITEINESQSDRSILQNIDFSSPLDININNNNNNNNNNINNNSNHNNNNNDNDNDNQYKISQSSLEVKSSSSSTTATTSQKHKKKKKQKSKIRIVTIIIVIVFINLFVLMLYLDAPVASPIIPREQVYVSMVNYNYFIFYFDYFFVLNQKYCLLERNKSSCRLYSFTNIYL